VFLAYNFLFVSYVQRHFLYEALLLESNKHVENDVLCLNFMRNETQVCFIFYCQDVYRLVGRIGFF